jgi:hypothetical protein
VSDTTIRGVGLAVAVAYAVLIGWMYVYQPATLADVTGGFSVAIGTYRIDEQAFNDGLQYFRNDQFVEARAALERADPAHRDALTQFYLAYAFYRQGWGRVYSDDVLFKQGLEAVDRAIALAPEGRLRVAQPGQHITSADELRAELQAGLTRESSDFNPLRVFRTRK